MQQCLRHRQAVLAVAVVTLILPWLPNVFGSGNERASVRKARPRAGVRDSNAGGIEFVGRWGYGPANAIQVSDGTAFLGSGTMLLALDTSDPTTPELLGQIDLGSPIWQIERRDQFLYVLCSNLVIFDVSQPAAPRRLASWGVAKRNTKMRLQGDYAYLLDMYRGLTVLDVSNPAHPWLAGHFSPPLPSWDLATAGDRLYLNTGMSIVIADISQPARPRYLATFEKGAASLAAAGRYLYVAAPSPVGPHSLQVFDASNPEDVRLLAEHQQDMGRLKLSGSALYCCTSSAVHVYDVTQPANLRPVWHIAKVGFDVAVSEELLYLAGRARGLTIVDVHNLNAKVEASYMPTLGIARSVLALGKYVYLLNGNRVSIFDKSDPLSPTFVANLDLPENNYLTAMCLNGSYLYVRGGPSAIFDVSKPGQPVKTSSDNPLVPTHVQGGFGYSVMNGLFQVFDLSQAANPLKVAELSVGQGANRLVLAGNLAFVFVQGTIKLFDLSQPPALTPAGEVKALYGPTDAVRLGNVVLLADGHQLTILDVSSAGNPVVVQSLPIPALSLFLSANTLYTGNAGFRLQVLNVSNPRSPVEVVSTPVRGPLESVVVDNGTAYFAASSWGLGTLDVGDPADLRVEIGGYATPGSALHIVQSGSHAYVGEDYSVRTLDLSDPANPRETAVWDESADYVNAVAVHGNFLYVVLTKALRIFDLADPVAPEQVAALPLYYGTAIGFSGNNAYVTSGTDLVVIDVSNPAAPRLVGSGWNRLFTGSLAILSDRGYSVELGGGQMIFTSLQDPLNPQSDYLWLNAAYHPTVKDVATDGRYAFAILWDFTQSQTSLLALDYSSPSQGTVLSQTVCPANVTRVMIEGDRLYATAYPEGRLLVFDISNPAQPRLIADVRTPGESEGAGAGENLVTLADGLGGVRVYRKAW